MELFGLHSGHDKCGMLTDSSLELHYREQKHVQCCRHHVFPEEEVSHTGGGTDSML